MFASRDYTTISFGIFFYVIFQKSQLVLSLTIFMSLSTWLTCSSASIILTLIFLNALHTVSNLFSPNTVSMFIWRAVNTNGFFFRPFADLVAPRPCIFVNELNLLLNDTVKMKMWTFTNIKYTSVYLFLWWSSSTLGDGTRGKFYTRCSLFRDVFPFNMANIGPYMVSDILMSSTVTLVLIIWLL